MSRDILSLPAGRRGVAWRFPRRDGVALRMVEPHSHDEFEINLVTSGRATYIVSGERKVLRPRSLIWLFPEQEHILQNFTSDFTMWILVISPEFTEQMVPRIPILAERDPGTVLMRTIPSKCVRLLDEVAQELSTGFQPLDCHELGLAWWLTSAWNAYEYGDSKDAGPLHSAVSRAMALLRENPSKNLRTLAQQTRISPSQLSRLFKRQAGVSITDFRNRLRLDIFVDRCDGARDSSMFELAKDSGFGSYAQFSRVFRRHMGCSPETYYRTLRQKKQPQSHLPNKPALSPSAPL
jgi:AraC-like DNA-binding protein